MIHVPLKYTQLNPVHVTASDIQGSLVGMGGARRRAVLDEKILQQSINSNTLGFHNLKKGCRLQWIIHAY